MEQSFSVSQNEIKGAEQACTVISVLACYLKLLGVALGMEWCIETSVPIYALWKKSTSSNHLFSYAKEIIDLLKGSLSICSGEEFGGKTQSSIDDIKSLWELILENVIAYPAVLTIGAFSISLLSDCELFDSHPQPEHNNKAVYRRFASSHEMVQYLSERYPGDQEYSLCSVEWAPVPTPPSICSSEEEARKLASAMPGLLHILKSSLGKEFVVGGAKGLYHYTQEEERPSLCFLNPQVHCSFGAIVQFGYLEENPSEEEYLRRFKQETAKLYCGNNNNSNSNKIKDVIDSSFTVTSMVASNEEKGEEDDNEEEEEEESSKSCSLGSEDSSSGPRRMDTDDDKEYEEKEESNIEDSSSSSGPRRMNTEDEEVGDDRDVHFRIDNPAMIFENAESRNSFLENLGKTNKKLLLVYKYDEEFKARKVFPARQPEDGYYVIPKSLSLTQFTSMMLRESKEEKQQQQQQMTKEEVAKEAFKPKFNVSFAEPLTLNKKNDRFEAKLENMCKKCVKPHLVMEMERNRFTIRCKTPSCSGSGNRWHRPSKGEVDLSSWFPAVTKKATIPMTPEHAEQVVALFMEEVNFVAGLDALEGDSVKEKLDKLRDWGTANKRQDVLSKVDTVEMIFSDRLKQACYRECLIIDPTFAYPPKLIPQTSIALVQGLLMHLKNSRGYKRMGEEMFVLFEDQEGRVYYKSIPVESLVAYLCKFEDTPNLCHTIVWKTRIAEDLKRMLQDEYHFPSIPPSKRYLGFINGVFDLEKNDFLMWDAIKGDKEAIPFNYVNLEFPEASLEHAKQNLPKLEIVDGKLTIAEGSLEDFVPTPLLDQPLKDQGFSELVMFWLFAFLGRAFHTVGKITGDRWELVPFLVGFPGTFKSSIITLLMRFFQPSQCGMVSLKVEPVFSLGSLIGKMIIVNTECGGCNLDQMLFQQMGSGDPLSVSVKYKNAINIDEWQIPMFFAGNSFLNVSDFQGAVERRSVVFPFVHTVAAEKGDASLLTRIFEQEGALALIKWNLLYCAVCNVVSSNIAGKTQVRSLLPEEILEATHQAIIENDSFRSFLAQECIITPGNNKNNNRLSCSDLLKSYHNWCAERRKKPISIDLDSLEAQGMWKKMGIKVLRKQKALAGIRFRNFKDPPYRPIFTASTLDEEEEEDDDDDDDQDNSRNMEE